MVRIDIEILQDIINTTVTVRYAALGPTALRECLFGKLRGASEQRIKIIE